MDKKHNFNRYELIEGRIYSKKKGNFLSHKPTTNGYCMVTVYDDEGNRHTMLYGKLMLILSDFREDWKDFDCDHIDGDEKNDSLDNLQWMSHKDNVGKRDKSTLKGREPHIYVIEHLEEGGKTEVFLRLQDAKSAGYNPNTLHTLATGKEGKNYSLKSKIAVRRYTDEEIIEYIKNKRNTK